MMLGALLPAVGESWIVANLKKAVNHRSAGVFVRPEWLW
jgi:hypothetical protein